MAYEMAYTPLSDLLFSSMKWRYINESSNPAVAVIAVL